MNLSEVRTTLRDRILTLDYEELTTAFDTDKIPETLADKSFHITVLGGTAQNTNMHDLMIDNEVEIVLWRKGFREQVSAVDAALCAVCDVTKSLMEVIFRTRPTYRNIQMAGYRLEPIAGDNDNIVKIIMTFTVQVSLAVTVQSNT